MVAAKIEIERAHLRDSDRVRNRFGHILEYSTHLLRALEKKLVTFRLHSLGIIECRVRLDANEEILCRRVFLAAIVHVIRRDEWQIECPRQRDEVSVDADLIRYSMI